MNLRFIWTDAKEVIYLLGLFFAFFVFFGLTGLNAGGTNKLANHMVQDQTAVKVISAVIQALVWVVSAVPMVFIIRSHNQDKISLLPTLVALPISRLSLGVHRYLGVLIVQGLMLFALAAFDLFINNLAGMSLISEPPASIAAKAGLFLAVMAIDQLLADIFPGSATPSLLFSAFAGLGIFLSSVAGVAKPGLFLDPFVVSGAVMVLIVVEISVFLNRRTFI